MGAKKKAAGAKAKGGKGKKEKKPKDVVGEAVNEVEEAERKASEGSPRTLKCARLLPRDSFPWSALHICRAQLLVPSR